METRTRILLVEDDVNLGSLLADYLRAKEFAVELRGDGIEGMKAFKEAQFDLIILDVMMPRKDGFTVAREIRLIDDRTPIFFLTAKNMKQDTILGFQSGADDYLTKPFSMEELLLRVRAVLKRTKGIDPAAKEVQKHTFGDLVFDVRKQVLTNSVTGEDRKLTTKESALLHQLCLNKNSLLERNKALREIWGDDSYFNARSMDVYIAKLRKYVKDDPKVEIINIHGQGFRLAVQPEM